MHNISKKRKGINAERDLLHRFWSVNSWCSVRVAGSGSMKYPSADILASNNKRKLAIECKTTSKATKYIPNEELEQLRVFAELFGAEAWIGVKFDREEWRFFDLKSVSKNTKNLVISLKKDKIKGISFKELLELEDI